MVKQTNIVIKIVTILALVFFVVLLQQSCMLHKKATTLPIDSSKVEKQTNIATVDTEYYSIVEKPAQFQSPDFNVFRMFLKKSTNYPYAALKKKQQGTVVIQFGVSCYGETKFFSILKSSGVKMLDDEAVRALKALPKWEPAKMGNKSVGQIFVIQVKFDAKKRSVTIK